MKGNNQNNYDRRPKRRKDKLNPYTIYSVGVNTDDPHYYVSFVDIDDKRINVEVSKDVFDTFEQFELEDLSHSNEVTNHYEHSDLLESTLNRRSNEESISLEDRIIERIQIEDLHKAISALTSTQKRRIYLLFFEGLNYKEIAIKEGCKYQMIQKSITLALKKIKKFLGNRGVF